MFDQESHTNAAMAVHEPYEPNLQRSPDVLTIGEAARFLCISTRTLERYIREAAIPYAPLPKRGARGPVRFLRSQLIKWLQQRTVRPDRCRPRNDRL